MDYDKTGNLIQSARKEKGLTQLQLAEKLGVTDRAVSKWERGKSFPDVSMLRPLADELGLTVTELLDGEFRRETEPVTAAEAEQAAIRGIGAYVSHTRKKSKPLWVLLAVMLVMLAAVGIYEYDRYSHIPLNFQEDELEFGDIVYVIDNEEKYSFSLEGDSGEELREQITAYFRNEMPQAEEVTKNPEVRAKMACVDFEGLVTFYFDCYYDYKSEKYYSFPWVSAAYRNLTSVCEDLLADEGYEYTGPLHFENNGPTLDIECRLTEKPMELIVGYYRDSLSGFKSVDIYNPEAYSSYVIEDITRLSPCEYEEIWEVSHLMKETAYRDAHFYRIYSADVTYKYTDVLKAMGPQHTEGTRRMLFMAAKSYNGDDFEIRDEYIVLLTMI